MPNSDTLNIDSEFYWDNVVFKVEDKLFCVPRCGFIRSSEVFADMFLLPSGPGAPNEGQDREHPIVLEGYKKNEFACLLRVMYPTADTLLAGTKLDMCLEKEEWVSVLKLSVIWDMKKIRDYAIHRLSTDLVLSAIEKILLGRAHKVAAWLDEGLSSLARGDYNPTIEDLGKLGWETAARIIWIKDNSSPFVNGWNINLRFRRDGIKCAWCTTSSSLIKDSYNCVQCGQAILSDEDLTYVGPGSNSAVADRLVPIRSIQSSRCRGHPFTPTTTNFNCSSCSRVTNYNHNVRIALNEMSREMIKEMFGEEIRDYELATTVA